MKRFVYLALCGIMVLSMVGCGQTKQKGPDESLRVEGESTEERKDTAEAVIPKAAEKEDKSGKSVSNSGDEFDVIFDDLLAEKDRYFSAIPEPVEEGEDIDWDDTLLSRHAGQDIFSVGPANFEYNGEHDISVIWSHANENIMAVNDDTDDKLSSFAVYSSEDADFNKEGFDFVISKNNQHQDQNDNVYYTADKTDGTASFIAFTYNDIDYLYVIAYDDPYVFENCKIYMPYVN